MNSKRPENEAGLSATAESHPSYDRRCLDGVVAGNEPLRRRILTEYLRTAPVQVGQLLSHLAAGDRDEAGRVAHTLKGSSRTIGAFALGSLCEQVEHASADSQHDTEAIYSEFESVRRAVAADLESIP